MDPGHKGLKGKYTFSRRSEKIRESGTPITATGRLKDLGAPINVEAAMTVGPAVYLQTLASVVPAAAVSTYRPSNASYVAYQSKGSAFCAGAGDGAQMSTYFRTTERTPPITPFS